MNVSTTDSATPPPPCPPYENAWLRLPDERLVRTSLVIDGEIAAFMRGKHPNHGHLQIAVSILLQKFFEEYKRVEPGTYKDYDPAGYELALTGCRLVLGGKERDDPPTPKPLINVAYTATALPSSPSARKAKAKAKATK